MNSTLQALIITLAIFALASLFGLIEWQQQAWNNGTINDGRNPGNAQSKNLYHGGKSQ